MNYRAHAWNLYNDEACTACSARSTAHRRIVRYRQPLPSLAADVSLECLGELV